MLDFITIQFAPPVAQNEILHLLSVRASRAELLPELNGGLNALSRSHRVKLRIGRWRRVARTSMALSLLIRTPRER